MVDKDNLKKEDDTNSKDKIIHTLCSSHCGGTCEIKVHVREGKIIRSEPVEKDGRPSMCLRGHAYRQRVYSPDRLLYPLKRTGPRGSGEFTRISWDEALETIAGELKRIKATYGNAAILHFCSMCDPYVLHHVAPFHSLLCEFGGYTAPWGLISNEGLAFSAGVTFGAREKGRRLEQIMQARLIIMWGWNPVTTAMGTHTPWALGQAKEKGTRFIYVDPRYSDSAATFADEWIPIRPGTDVAVMMAMAHVIIKENLQDQQFIDRYTVGFDTLKNYVLGVEDGIPKTPEWAEAISDMPATAIAYLARKLACDKPAILGTSIAPGRTAYGEQFHRAATALEAITGNLELENYTPSPRSFRFIPPFPFQLNQVEKDVTPRRTAIPYRGSSVNSSARVNVSSFADAVLKGKAGGYPADYKFMWLSNNNYLNQLGDINTALKAFNKLEFILVTEQFMTATAKIADIVLPVCTYLERCDLLPPIKVYSVDRSQFTFLEKAIEPLGESKSQLQICQALAIKLGIDNYGNKSDEELARYIVEEGSKKIDAKPKATPKKEPTDPDQKLFPTPSGKVEINSSIVEKMKHPLIPAIPKYLETWESRNDPLADKYPLQLITPHFKRRAHSQFDNLPWLRELQDQAITINSSDAEARGIKHGDMVRVFNDRGETRIPARVTERIMPGVASLPQGAWYTPDENGIDHGGSANMLTRNVTSPAGAFPGHTALVQIKKV